MGGDYYVRDEAETTNTSSSTTTANITMTSSSYSSAAEKVVGIIQEMHRTMNPTQWAKENLLSETAQPIVFALDVTGSMGEWAKIIYDKMPMFYGQIMMQKYLEDPSVSFCAIGDVKTDKAPIQIAEFGEAKGIDQMISKLYLEGGGGGNLHESYDLAAYFYNNCVDLKNCDLPFFFVTGDEAYWDTSTSDEIKRVFGRDVQSEVISFQEWQILKEKYNVFHIKKSHFQDSTILPQWFSTLGEERVLEIETPKACIDVILGAISLTSGARDLLGYIEDMKNRGQTDERIFEVSKALRKYANSLLTGKTKIIRQNSDLHITQITAIPTITSSTTIRPGELDELRECYETSLGDLSNEQKEYLARLNKLSGDIPNEFLCPITQKIMLDPTMTVDGVTYERKAIELWLENHDCSPITEEKLQIKLIMPNKAMQAKIYRYLTYQEYLARKKLAEIDP